MSNLTARSDALATIAGEIDDALRPVVVLDCADLAALADRDIRAAALKLAALTAPQLVTQAHAYAAYVNAIDPEAELNGDAILTIFQACIAKHAPIAIPAILDALCVAVDAARIAAAGDSRWTNAINAGYSWLLTQEAVIFDRSNHELTVNSPSGETYHANGACQCKAFVNGEGIACWHRAAARLVRRALEGQRPTVLQALGCRLAAARAAALELWA